MKPWDWPEPWDWVSAIAFAAIIWIVFLALFG